MKKLAYVFLALTCFTSGHLVASFGFDVAAEPVVRQFGTSYDGEPAVYFYTPDAGQADTSGEKASFFEKVVNVCSSIFYAAENFDKKHQEQLDLHNARLARSATRYYASAPINNDPVNSGYPSFDTVENDDAFYGSNVLAEDQETSVVTPTDSQNGSDYEEDVDADENGGQDDENDGSATMHNTDPSQTASTLQLRQAEPKKKTFSHYAKVAGLHVLGKGCFPAAIGVVIAVPVVAALAIKKAVTKKKITPAEQASQNQEKLVVLQEKK